MTHMMVPFSPPQVLGLTHATQKVLDQLVQQWASKMPRNIERMQYLDAKNKLKDLRVSLPPEIVGKLEVVMGWPAKAVYELANRITLDGIRGADEDRDPMGLVSMMDDNRFGIEFPQAIASSLSQSLSFMTTTPGDVGAGEPEVLIQFHSALWATGTWSRRARALTSGMVVTEVDPAGLPTRLVLMVPGEAITITKGERWYVEDVQPTYLRHVPMEALPFRPTLERPMGRARIDRPVMSVTDRAMRAAARLESHSELFSALKLILLGASEDAFRDAEGNPIPLWSFYMGRLNMLDRDENGDLPVLERVTAESPEPHIAVMRQMAAEFSGHTGVPLGSLGISTDNPESAGAKQEARQDIVGDAEAQHVLLTAALRRGFGTGVMLRDGLSEMPTEMRDLQFRWRPPNRPTLSAMADAGAKQVSAIPGLAETEVGMELVGMDPGQIRRVLDDRTRARASANMRALLGSPEPVVVTDGEPS